jgi:hypothetical protein
MNGGKWGGRKDAARVTMQKEKQALKKSKLHSCHESDPDEPLGYLQWHDWSEEQGKAGRRQKRCGVCNLWYWPGRQGGEVKIGEEECPNCGTKWETHTAHDGPIHKERDRWRIEYENSHSLLLETEAERDRYRQELEEILADQSIAFKVRSIAKAALAPAAEVQTADTDCAT